MRISVLRMAPVVIAIAIFIGSAVAAPQPDPYDVILDRAYTYVWFAASTQNPKGLFFHEATGLFAEAAELRPGDPEPQLMAAVAYQVLGEYAQAEKHYVAAAENAEDPAVWLLLADLYLSRGRLDEAEIIYREAIENQRAVVTALIGLGEVAARRHHFDEAIQHFEAALEREPGHVRGVVMLARAYLDTGQPEQALERLETLNKDRVWQLSYHAEMARTHAALGDQESACYFVNYVTWRDGEELLGDLPEELACSQL